MNQMNKNERALQEVLITQAENRGLQAGHKSGFHMGMSMGMKLGVMLMSWSIHERYGWNRAVQKCAFESVKFASEYMTGRDPVLYTELENQLKEECGIDFKEMEKELGRTI